MNEAPDFEKYSYEMLLEVFKQIDEQEYPDRKEHVAKLLDERKDEYQTLLREKARLRKYTTFVPRLIAGVVDGLCLMIATFLILKFMGFSSNLNLLFLQVLLSLIPYVYSMTLHGLYGQTIGKMVTGIKVVEFSNETAINFKQALLRDSIPVALTILSAFSLMVLFFNDDDKWSSAISYIILFFWFLHQAWFLIEVVTMLLDEKRRALHDYIASTVVVRTHE